MDYFEEMKKWEDALPHKDDGGLRLISGANLYDSEPPSPYRDGMMWGPWRLDTKNVTLTHTTCYGRNEGYEIDLEELNTCGAMLDVIFQVSEKVWCTHEDAGCLVSALEHLLSPQENLCSGGGQKEFSASRFLKKQLGEASAR